MFIHAAVTFDYYIRCGPPFMRKSELPVCCIRDLNPGLQEANDYISDMANLCCDFGKDFSSSFLCNHQATSPLYE